MTTTIPDGWKLVPIEPNEAMLDAGCKQHRCEQGDPWYSSPDLSEGDCKAIYAAMLDAAPAHPASVAPGDAQAVAWMDPETLDVISAERKASWLSNYGIGGANKAARYTRALGDLRPAPAAGDAQTAATRDVLAERQRQISAEGWTPDHDDQYQTGQLASAAGCYAMFTQAYPAGDPVSYWPWSEAWWKPSAEPRRNLVKAGALILAEIERLDRAAQRKGDA
ncbi:hypothetical protein [Achromobacter xylosoxidans]|uniref:hypothetical protein n=1 Tax=Alcaligenes xylosoxydans xylosoxydans TaxID=85698 RepID=UPI003F7603AC